MVTSVSTVTPDLPLVREAFSRLWADVNRLWPATTEMRDKIPGLGTFEVRPPPPPPPRTWTEKAGDWIQEHPYSTVGVGLGVIGTGLLVGYGGYCLRRDARLVKMRAVISDRKQVIGELSVVMQLACQPLIASTQSYWAVILLLVWLLSWNSRDKATLSSPASPHRKLQRSSNIDAMVTFVLSSLTRTK